MFKDETMAVKEDWKGPVFNSEFTRFEAVEAI